MSEIQRIFVGATRQNDGKTLVSLGLFNAFRKRFNNLGYMKPVGQQYKIIDSKKIDKDAILFQKVYDLKDPFPLMSPIAVPSGFTENYIVDPNPKELRLKVQTAFDQLSQGKDFVLFEGTGHAGVGSVFDLSNAHVAKLVGSKVIIVSLGGIGRSIDEIMLNKSLFDQLGVEVLGVVINKVKEDKYDKISSIVRKGLARHGIRVLGVIPFVNSLTKPTVRELLEDLGAELLTGEAGLMNNVEKFMIGDMLPHQALNYFTNNTLLIVPANREDLVMTALCGNLLETDLVYYVSAVIFTGGIRPHERIMRLIKHTHIPFMHVEEDSFTIATKINNMLVKVRSEETEKIKIAQELVEKYVEVDKICEYL